MKMVSVCKLSMECSQITKYNTERIYNSKHMINFINLILSLSVSQHERSLNNCQGNEYLIYLAQVCL
jgi:hypothetical protein